MSQSTEKSLGQVAHEGRGMMFAGSMAFAEPVPWAELPKWKRDECEDMAQAVAAAVREQCAQACEVRAGMRGTGAWTALTAAADAIRSMKP